MKRQLYLRSLRKLIKKYGSDNVIYFDESGFATHTHRPYAYAKYGTPVFGDVKGNNYARTNLIMAQRGKEWLAPMLFKGGCHKGVVEAWLEQMLLPELNEPSLVIMDNASFHDKAAITELLKEKGHTLMPLPPYSPDFNPIEQSFAVIKKRRICNNLNLEEILMSHLNLK